MAPPAHLTQAFFAKAREERLAAGAAVLGHALLGAYAPHVLALARTPMPGRQHVLRDDPAEPIPVVKATRNRAADFIHHRADPTVHTLRHESGRLAFGTRTTLMAPLGLTAWGLTDLLQGRIKSHKGWRLVKA